MYYLFWRSKAQNRLVAVCHSLEILGENPFPWLVQLPEAAMFPASWPSSLWPLHLCCGHHIYFSASYTDIRGGHYSAYPEREMHPRWEAEVAVRLLVDNAVLLLAFDWTLACVGKMGKPTWHMVPRSRLAARTDQRGKECLPGVGLEHCSFLGSPDLKGKDYVHFHINIYSYIQKSFLKG